MVQRTYQKSSKIINNRGLKIEWFLVSFLDHFFSLLGSQRLPNRSPNHPKILPNGPWSWMGTCFLSDLVTKSPKMFPGGQKVMILDSKMTPQSSKLDPKTTPRAKKLLQNDTRTQFWHVILNTLHVTLPYLTLCTFAISKRYQSKRYYNKKHDNTIQTLYLSYVTLSYFITYLKSSRNHSGSKFHPLLPSPLT